MNYREIDLNLLLVLDAMMKEQSVTAVSRKLLISQPTVSFSLKKLREILDDELFVRTGSGMQPTPRAMALAGPIDQVIRIVRDEILSPPEFEPSVSDRRFVINATDIGEMVFLPPLLKVLREFAPHASIESVCLDPHDLSQALADGLVDLVIGYMPELTGSGLYTQLLFEHPFVCLASDTHPLLKDGITLEQYACAEHITLVGEGHSQQKFENMIEESGIKRRIVLRSQNFMNIPFIVRDSELLATVPKVIAAAFAHMRGLVAFWPPFELPAVPIRQYWHQRMHKDPAQVWLRQTVSELFLNKDPTAEFMVRQNNK
ncbi:MAG: LysR family transcriptional regulator [Candidatus Thiodiazotropha sp.]|jgi:DNA-binding transcriptional LysR family regulator